MGKGRVVRALTWTPTVVSPPAGSSAKHRSICAVSGCQDGVSSSLCYMLLTFFAGLDSFLSLPFPPSVTPPLPPPLSALIPSTLSLPFVTSFWTQSLFLVSVFCDRTSPFRPFTPLSDSRLAVLSFISKKASRSVIRPSFVDKLEEKGKNNESKGQKSHKTSLMDALIVTGYSIAVTGLKRVLAQESEHRG